MEDYFRMDITIGLDLESNKDILNESFGDNISNCDYDSRLLYNRRNPEYVYLTIYYKPSDFLFEKLDLLQKKGISILSIIKSKLSTNNWEFPDYLDFTKSTLINIQQSHYWEHNKKPVLIIIDNVDVFSKNSFNKDGRFKLTENIFQHLNEYIEYSSLDRYQSNDKFIEKNLNRETTFGPITFILSLEHVLDRKYSKQNINILRDAYLTLTDSKELITANELAEIGEFLCLLMSFYWGKYIDFFVASIRVNSIENYRTKTILKYSNHYIDESLDFLLKEKFETFYDFVSSIDYEKFKANSNILFEIIPRLLKAKNLDEISSFMILYNIIEKIRNHFLLNPLNEKKFTIKEEFDFKKGKNGTNKYIKNKIKEIKEIVADCDVEEFEKRASDKVNFIKNTGLIDQFDNLITYLELKPESYEIDFLNLIRIRNNIYHGKLPKENIELYIEEMKKLVYDMILKMVTR